MLSSIALWMALFKWKFVISSYSCSKHRFSMLVRTALLNSVFLSLEQNSLKNVYIASRTFLNVVWDFLGFLLHGFLTRKILKILVHRWQNWNDKEQIFRLVHSISVESLTYPCFIHGMNNPQSFYWSRLHLHEICSYINDHPFFYKR